MINSQPIVSVVMITYGHQAFIKDAILGVINQKFSGNIELIISNDNSPDQTDAVIMSFLKDYIIPIHVNIRYVKHEKNLGMMPNFLWSLNEAKGKYIALCDGDDYWIDPYKIEKQVSFLEANQDYNVCVGKYNFLFESNGIFKENTDFVDKQKALTVKDYLAFNFSHTSTFLFRNNIVYPEWSKDVFSGDQLMMILAVKDKKIKYFEDVFSVYRVSSVGITNHIKSKTAYEKTSFFLNKIDEYTAFKYTNILNNRRTLNEMYYKMTTSTNKFIQFYWKVKMYFFRKKITNV